ncbi:sensor histidine kinase [Streptacidiphilus neutrinimicus]|uniref:sensor histidine kinase n=1 Tax=Streptacidiphilus neutrinimicus TaxID=105420 RepID=UPI0006944557|nr:sensor histidine kinase [Streptacidiphilus neutrinimicus]
MLGTVLWALRVGALLFAGFETFGRTASLGGGERAVVITAVTLSALGMVWWWRQEARHGLADPARLPAASTRLVVVLAVMGAAGGFASSFPQAGALLAIPMMTVSRAGSEPRLAAGPAVTCSAVAAIEAGALVTGAGTGIVLGFPLGLLVALLIGGSRRAYRLVAAQNAERLAQAEELRVQQQRNAVLDERARIAREIHDVLAHSLGALSIQIQTARTLLEHEQTQRAAGLLDTAQRLSAEGLVETRRAVQALRTDTPPLPQTLERLAEEHWDRHRSPATVTVAGTPSAPSPETTLCLVRTAQECLTNAAKHAAGQPVRLALDYEDDHVTLTVTNPLGSAAGTDGTGAPRPRLATVNGGYGLTGMRERLLLIGGTLTAEATAGTWTVTARTAP